MAPHAAGSGNRGGVRFDDIEVDVAAHRLLRAGAPQPLEPKAFRVLLVLLQRPGQLVSHDELLDEVWGHRNVTPGVLTRSIVRLRTALGDDSHHQRYIQTHHALGYAFIGELESDPVPGPDAGSEGMSPAAGLPRRGRRRTDDVMPSPGLPATLALAGAALAVVSAVLVLWGQSGSGERRATDRRGGTPGLRQGAPGSHANRREDPA